MFSNNKGTNVIPCVLDNNKPAAGNNGQDGLFASSVIDKVAKSVIVKIVNTNDSKQMIKLNVNGYLKNNIKAVVTTFQSDSLDGENTLDEPNKYVPVTTQQEFPSNSFTVSVPAKSFVMYELKQQ